MALHTLPLLGETAVAPNPTYRIFKGFSYGPCRIRAQEETGHNIQGKSLQFKFLLLCETSLLSINKIQEVFRQRRRNIKYYQ